MIFFKNTRFLLLTFAVLISACSYPPLNTESGENFSDYTYQIGSGDRVDIFVWDNPDVSISVVVRPDGKITVPLAEEILVSGQTPFQVARKLEEVYKVFIQEPKIVVMVSEFQGIDAQQIRIIGQIGNESSEESNAGGSIKRTSRYRGKTIPYERGMTLLDVFIRIGSVSEFADGNRATIIRKVNGVQKKYSVKIDSLVEDGDLSENVAMLPGDILVIPEAFF